MAGVLNYKRYLNTLQTLTEVGNIFPGDQKTYTFTVGGTTSTQGWTATVSWETLIIDEMSYGKNNIPDFTDSKVLGIYTGTTISQYTTGTISIPANMYTGPILPAHVVNVPVTIVNIAWTKDGDDFANNIAYIQNWEPGVPINDPATGDGFEPVVSEPSTLTLTGPGGIIYQRSIELKAETDIPLYLGTTTRCYFYWDKVGGRELLGVAYFDPNTNIATLNYNTSGTQFTGGTYPIYAETNGFRQYGFARSNTIQQVVYEHIPLVWVSESRTPQNAANKYVVGEEFVFSQTFEPDPTYPPTGYPVSNVVRLYLRDAGQYRRNLPRILATTTFVNGVVSISQPITLDMFDTAAGPDWTGYNDSTTLSTGTLVGNTFTCVISVKNYFDFSTYWDVDLNGPYASGSRIGGGSFTAEYLPTKVITGEAYPITLTQPVSTSFLTEVVTFRVTKPTRIHGGYIKLMGRKGDSGSFTELSSFANGANASSESLTIDTLTTGTWTLYASFAGDLGTSFYSAYKNLASTSSTITHTVTLGQDLPVILTFQRTADYDVVRAVSTYGAITLPKNVSFYQGGSLINTSTWSRSTSTSISYSTSTLYESSSVFLNSFSELNPSYNFPSKYAQFRSKSPFESTSTYFANPFNRGVYHRGYTNVRTGEVVDPWVTFDAGIGVIALQRQLEDYFPRTLTFEMPISPPQIPQPYTTISITLTSYIGKYSDTMYLYNIQRGLPSTGQKFPAQRSDVIPDYVGPYSPTRYDPPNVPFGKTYMETFLGNFYIKTTTNQSINDYSYPSEDIWQKSGGWSYRGQNADIYFTWKYGQTYGKREWSITNPNNQTEVENVYYYNYVFAGLQQKKLAVVSTATVETPTIYTVYAGQNVAELLLPVGTIYNADVLRAAWPGTLDLDRSYGKFNSFDIGASASPSVTTIAPLTITTVDAHTNPFRPTWPNYPYYSNPTVISTTETSYIFSTNPVNLKVLVTVQNGGYGGQDSGTVTFYRVDTNQDIGSATVTSGTGVLSITADDIPGINVGTNTSITIGARFNGTLCADSTATNFITATVVRSSLDMIPYQFSRYMKNELGENATDWTVPGYDYTIPVVPYIPPTPLKTIYRSDYPGLQTPGRRVSIFGSYFNFEHPMTSFRGICSAYDNQDIYGQALNNTSIWDRSSNFYFCIRYTVVGGTYDGEKGWIVPPQFSDIWNNLCTYTKFDSLPNLGPGAVKYTMNNIIGRVSGNGDGRFVVGLLGSAGWQLLWTDNWTRIDIDISVVGTSHYNHGIASLAPGSKLGISSVWNVS